MLQDHLVCGVNQKGIQCQLLSNVTKAHELVLATEAIAKGSKDINTTVTQPLEPNVNYTRSANVQQNSGRTTHQWAKLTEGHQRKPTCYRCGESQVAAQCKFRMAECHKTGHIAKVCRSKPDVKAQSSHKKTHH